MKTKDEYKKNILKLRKEYLRDHCPYKVGQKIKIKGDSYVGKDGMVTAIKAVITYSGSIIYNVSGKVMKSNGKEGLNSFEFSEYDEA